MQNISSSILSMNDCAISFRAATQLLQNPLIIYFFFAICDQFALHCLRYGQIKILQGAIEE